MLVHWRLDDAFDIEAALANRRLRFMKQDPCGCSGRRTRTLLRWRTGEKFIKSVSRELRKAADADDRANQRSGSDLTFWLTLSLTFYETDEA